MALIIALCNSCCTAASPSDSVCRGNTLPQGPSTPPAFPTHGSLLASLVKWSGARQSVLMPTARALEPDEREFASLVKWSGARQSVLRLTARALEPDEREFASRVRWSGARQSVLRPTARALEPDERELGLPTLRLWGRGVGQESRR